LGIATLAGLESRVNIETQMTGGQKYAKKGRFARFSPGFSTVARVTGISANRYKR